MGKDGSASLSFHEKRLRLCTPFFQIKLRKLEADLDSDRKAYDDLAKRIQSITSVNRKLAVEDYRQRQEALTNAEKSLRQVTAELC
jgi:hypothetical protein